MELPGYQPFYIDSLDALRTEAARLGLAIPIDDDEDLRGPLSAPLVIGSRTVPNRFCAQPIAGGDADAAGAPGALTRRRYRRSAEGGFGLIWVEMIIAGPQPDDSPSAGAPGKLRLHQGTAPAFHDLVREIRATASENPLLILQLASGSVETIAHAATLAAEAGFDGVDLQCPRDLLAEAVTRVRAQSPGLLVAARLCVYEATRHGFGTAANDYRQPDPGEPIRLVRELQARGLALLNVTAASPVLRGADRGVRARSDAENPDEHPLMTLHRQLKLAQALREAVPGLPVVGSGFGWLRQFAPHVAAGAVREGLIDFAGLGRGALANPALPAQVLVHGHLAAESACMACFACAQLRAEGQPVGCVLRDAETYGPIYRQMRRFDADQLLAGAARCHLCEAAPCIAASPTRTDIPAFIQAFRHGDDARAYEIIRERDPLPELTSRYSPGWLESEGACIETTLTGTPVPILDLQYAIAWRARERGATGVRLPRSANEASAGEMSGGAPRMDTISRTRTKDEDEDDSPERHHPSASTSPPAPENDAPHPQAPPISSSFILHPSSFPPIALIGAGPAGLAAAIRLLELGHTIDLYEQSDRLGGVPARLLAPHRALTDPQAEIDAILAPALTAGRLRIHRGITIGKDLSLEELAGAGPAAILVATGLWQEPSLGLVPGVTGALAFLEAPGAGLPDRVAILAGGDSAMDAARAVQARGAKEIFIIFGGPRSAMHWHLPESWFATPGVQAMMQWQPLGYDTGADGRVCAVRLRHVELRTEAALPVDLVIEAMALQPSSPMQSALAAFRSASPASSGGTPRPRLYTAGALIDGGASVGHAVAAGLAAAETIHRDLSS